MARFRYTGSNIRTLGPDNASVGKEYRFAPGSTHTVEEADEKVFDALAGEFERLADPDQERPKRGK